VLLVLVALKLLVYPMAKAPYVRPLRSIETAAVSKPLHSQEWLCY
jgi:hypothetical protein